MLYVFALIFAVDFFDMGLHRRIAVARLAIGFLKPPHSNARVSAREHCVYEGPYRNEICSKSTICDFLPIIQTAVVLLTSFEIATFAYCILIVVL